MGMNFYTLNSIHIGKRFVNGVWDWDCRKRAILNEAKNLWICPRCRKTKHFRDLTFNPFDKHKPKKHKGIDGASGFIWQIGLSGLGSSVIEIKKKLERRYFMKTEYGEKWSIRKFWSMFEDVIEEKVESGEFS